MNIIAPRARGPVARARRGQLCRKVVARLGQLELLDGARRNVHRSRTGYLIRNVDAVHLDSSRAAETPAKGDGGIAVFTAEIRPVLDLNARFQLRQIEEIAAVDRQALNL